MSSTISSFTPVVLHVTSPLPTPSLGEDHILPDRPLTPSGGQVGDGWDKSAAAAAAAEDDTNAGDARPLVSSSASAAAAAVRKVGADGRPMTTWGGGDGSGPSHVPAPASSSSVRAAPGVKGSRMCL